MRAGGLGGLSCKTAPLGFGLEHVPQLGLIVARLEPQQRKAQNRVFGP